MMCSENNVEVIEANRPQCQTKAGVFRYSIIGVVDKKKELVPNQCLHTQISIKDGVENGLFFSHGPVRSALADAYAVMQIPRVLRKISQIAIR
ncbi:hypothetical protein CEXT_90171 [Caerostris extrusa]|uniref:Uncharacterized protein n=1 Tax=Caerostris extrusa TaxID=172846 RepID=A0AAV4UVW6_CAEEX|nr:hypothetical protein CEXT_90171 [Caerostris extrusa]